MKIDNPTQQEIESQGIQGQGNFTIKASAHAFQMLSSGLYTNKIQAVIRELSCNAADAHKLNSQQQQPFEIKIPNSLDTQFYVRDYGPGLDEQDVMTLYTTYFESTKQMSNDFTGGFGVGSKSPFAYTDTFTVVSIHQGKKTTYAAFVDEDGNPKIAKMSDAITTDEPSGLQVGFPVKPKDFAEFQKEALNVLQWFDAPFELLGTTQKVEPYHQRKIALNTPSAVVFGSQNPDRNPRSSQQGTLLMGNVHYPLAIDDAIANNTKAEWLRHFHIVYKAPIGSVSVAASREALQYDRRTRATLPELIDNTFEQVASMIWKKLRKEIDKSDASSFEAHSKAVEALGTWGLKDPKLREIFLKTVNATPDEIELLKTRHLLDSKPTTFSIVSLSNHFGYGHNHKDVSILGTPAVWKSTSNFELDTKSSYAFIENGARAFSDNANVQAKKVIAGLNVGYRGEVFQIIPKEDAFKHPKKYQEELAAWKKSTGFKITPFTKIGQQYKAPDAVIGIDITDWSPEFTMVTSSDKPFFYVTETEYQQLTGSKVLWNDRKVDRGNKTNTITSRNLEELQKVLKIEPNAIVKRFMVIPNDDVANIKTFGIQGVHLYEEFAKGTLLQEKYQKRIRAIKPMMDSLPTTFSSLRIRLRKDPQWSTALAGTPLADWMKRLDTVKGGASMDATATVVLKAMQEQMTPLEFPSAIPEYYNGTEVHNWFNTHVPMLGLILFSKHMDISHAMKQVPGYLQWQLREGVKTPVPIQTSKTISAQDVDVDASTSPPPSP